MTGKHNFELSRRPKYLAVAGLVALCVLSPFSSASSPLSSYVWKNRIILVDDRGVDSDALLQFKEAAEYVDDRDVVWFILDEDGYASNSRARTNSAFVEELRRHYFFKGTHRVVLIGKDGGVKKISEHLDLAALFELIDSMPMRRREMQDWTVTTCNTARQ